MEQNLSVEEEKLLNKIDHIKESENVQELLRVIAANAENLGAYKIKTRIKNKDSAINKFREKDYQTADRMGDLCGVMIITENEEDIYNISNELSPLLSNSSTEDYIKNPKAGYRSVHMNSTFNDIEDLNGIDLPLEIQLKTKYMYIAQESIHNTIYKNKELNKDVRDELSTALFPIVEKSLNLNDAIKENNIDSCEKLSEELFEIKQNNSTLLNEYNPYIQDVWEEVAVTCFEENIDNSLSLESYLCQDTALQKENKFKKISKSAKTMFKKFYNKAKYITKKIGYLSGNYLTDYAFEKMSSLSLYNFYALNKKLTLASHYTNRNIKISNLNPRTNAKSKDRGEDIDFLTR